MMEFTLDESEVKRKALAGSSAKTEVDVITSGSSLPCQACALEEAFEGPAKSLEHRHDSAVTSERPTL